MNITIIGAGNMGLALAAYIARHKKGQVTIFTKKDIEELVLRDEERKECVKVEDYAVTDDPHTAFWNADIVLCTYPAFLRREMLGQYEPYFRQGLLLGFVPGYGGIEYGARDLIKKGVIVFGMQRVPYVARAQRKGNAFIAGLLSEKKKLFLAAIPYAETGRVVSAIRELLDILCVPLKEYLAITLAPSNPILHITGLYHAFHGWKEGESYRGPEGFYEQWDDDASELLFQYDAELQSICRGLKDFDLREVVPLSVYYESDCPRKMTEKLKSIEAFRVVRVPLKETEYGMAPDLSSRMFVEDFPYGICIFKDFARMVGVETPVIDRLLAFYERLTGKNYFLGNGSYGKDISETGIPGLNGIRSIEDLDRFYHKMLLV